MRVLALAGAAVGVALWAGPGPAADLAKVDRRVGKEPAYRPAGPRYCLLAFGPEAGTRVWMACDGDALYVDKNGNGDLTDPGDRVAGTGGSGDAQVFEVGDIQDGPLVHTKLVVTRSRATEDLIGNAKEWDRIKAEGGGDPAVWTVRVAAERPAGDDRPLPRRIGYVVNGDGQGWLAFARRPEDAPVIHFNGPWTLDLQDVNQRLEAGREKMLQIGVGTRGVGPGTFTWVLYPNTIPADAYPEAEVVFPAKAGADPVTKRFVLKKRC